MASQFNDLQNAARRRMLRAAAGAVAAAHLPRLVRSEPARGVDIVGAPSNLGLRPLRPGHIPGARRAPGVLRAHRVVERLGARDRGDVEATVYDPSTDPASGYRNGANLATYAWTTQSADYTDGWTYAYSDYQGPWQPARETVTETGGTPFGYALAYDSYGRLTTVTPDSGDPTTYTYDDAALTITADTGNGAWTEVLTYDSAGRELADAWGGSDPSAIAGDYTFAWDGDNVVAETYRSATADSPTTLQTIEVDTLRYDCAMARTAGTGHAARIRRH